MKTDKHQADTIAAIATASGKGGVAVIRISGAQALSIGKAITGISPTPRQAHFCQFKNNQQQIIDSGLLLYFSGPNSFTGEDIIELQGHGGPVVQDILMKQIISLGARQARPGEFSERAFLNDKIDLAQAEAIADLIDSSTEQAALGAMRSLQGEFSNKINQLLASLIECRMHVEAAIDFPEEEIDFLADEQLLERIHTVQNNIDQTLQQANQGRVLRNGLQIVLAGKPNAGKSSLLNALSGYDSAIVTAVAGTTRDTISETLDIDGLPVHITDTAGLRESDDEVEKIGIQRAHAAIEKADHVLYLIDASEPNDEASVARTTMEKARVAENKLTIVYNKIDLASSQKHEASSIAISALNGDGIEKLKNHIKKIAGYQNDNESVFTARRRHITALQSAQQSVKQGLYQLQQYRAGELLADELLQAQNALSEITGEFSADDLLGEIFSGFCIGK